MYKLQSLSIVKSVSGAMASIPTTTAETKTNHSKPQVNYRRVFTITPESIYHSKLSHAFSCPGQLNR